MAVDIDLIDPQDGGTRLRPVRAEPRSSLRHRREKPMSTSIASTSVIPDLLSQNVESDPVSLFVLHPDREWTYGDFSDAVDRFASGLLALGVSKGDRVAIAAPNSPEWLITWFAAARIGAILVTLNVAYREREFDYMLNQSSAKMLVICAKDGDFDFVAFVDELRSRIPTVEHFVFVHGNGFEGSRRWEDVATVVDAAALADHTSRLVSTDPAVILYTSGTTGNPKGATLTHASIIASAMAQAEHLGQTADDVSIGHMPLNHVGGMTCTVAAAMVAGGRVALLPRYSPQMALTAIDRYGVTIFIGVPTMYTLMMNLAEFPDARTSSVRTCIIGGSNVEPALGQRILTTFQGARLANLYGLSETSGGCIISAANDDLDTLVATLGVPIGHFEVRIADDQNEPLPAGSEGELHVRGACVAGGYWDSEEETRKTFLDRGWLATGDMARQTEHGRIALCGRKKEMYVRGGYNVYPVEIENVLARHESVAMSAVIGVADDLHGEVGHAYVVAAAGHVVDPDALLEHCRTQLARYKVPDKIEVVESLPLTPSGKIKKVALKKAYYPLEANG
jgi:acyl-CoA synthetase (AMP-forming)/AMP-acid ligase II